MHSVFFLGGGLIHWKWIIYASNKKSEEKQPTKPQPNSESTKKSTVWWEQGAGFESWKEMNYGVMEALKL